MHTHMGNEFNHSIGCDVKDCKYHAQHENYCSLNKINVVQHSTPTTNVESTDCGSFEPK